MGTSEFYSVVEEMDGVVDSLVVDTGSLITEGLLLLFVVMNEGTGLDDSFHEQLASRLRTHLSPRHVPDQIHTIPEVPRTLNGKKVEVPVKKILMGESADVAISRDALSNPGSIGFFEALAGTLDPA